MDGFQESRGRNVRSNNYQNRGPGGDRGGYQNSPGRRDDRGGYNRGDSDRGGYQDRGGRGGGGNFRGRGRGGGGGNAPRFSGPPRPECLSGEGAIFSIIVKPGSIAYRYDVEMTYKYRKTAFNNKAESTDGVLHLTTDKRDARARQLCYQILSIALEDTGKFGCGHLEVAYDNQTTLFADKRFSRIVHSIDKSSIPEEHSSNLPGDGIVELIVSQNDELFEVALDDIQQYEARELLLTEDQTVRQTLEIILSQGAIDSGKYSLIGSGQLFRHAESIVERGFCTRVGSHKGIRMVDLVEGGKKKIQPAIVIDFKKSPFFCHGNFYTILMEFIHGSTERGGHWEEAAKAFKGVRVVPVYARGRVLRFTSFTQELVKDMTLTLDDGEKMSLPDFFARKKKCRLTHVDCPAAKCGNAGDFPLELLDILPDQKVDMENIPGRIRDAVHTQNAVPPQTRYNNIMDEFLSLGFNNDVTKAFGISIDMNPISGGSGTVLKFDRPEKPEIMFGNNRKVFPNSDGRFNIGNNQFYVPCKIDKWVVLLPDGQNPRYFDPAICKTFVDMMVEQAQKHGVMFGSPPVAQRIDAGYNTRGRMFKIWNDTVTKLKKDGYRFIMFIDQKINTEGHMMLKLMESMHKVVTQQVNFETARKIVQMNQYQTLGNILLKVNVKNGGTNYKPLFHADAKRMDINSGKVLVIGYDVSHPTGVSPGERDQRLNEGFESETKDPSTVGITANFGKDPSSFIGDFFFQATRKEAVDRKELKMYMARILNHLKKNREGVPGFKMPEVIVILRDGVSEGQFKMACEEELPALKDGCFAFSQTYKPQFVFIVATKRHHKRFFEGEGGRFENPAPGTFVNNVVVRPDCIEFFMQAHKAIKGSAKSVQVSVVVNELNADRKEIGNFLHCLCYGHQVVCSPTSLPTPVYIADELATRGSEIYKKLKDLQPTNIPWKDNEIDYLLLTHMLNYSESALANVRFNA